MLDLQRPPAVAVALCLDECDRFGHALVWGGIGSAQVLQSPQHVVVPPRRKSEAGPCSVVLAIALDHLAGGPSPEQATLKEILLPAEAGLRHIDAAPASQF